MNTVNLIPIETIFIKTDTATFIFSVKNKNECISINIKSSEKITTEVINFFFSFNSSLQLQNNDAWKLSIENKKHSIKKYNNRYFNTEIDFNLSITASEKEIEILIPNSTNKVDFAFCPSITKNGNDYSLIKNYITSKYLETWYVLKENNTIYINDIFKNRQITNWIKSSFKNQETMHVGVIKEKTVEESIIAMCIAEDKGCAGFDLHLNLLDKNGLLSVDNISKICKTSSLPILALNYNPEISQEERLKGLELAIHAGCSAIDFQGFMFCEEKTSSTHTPENKKYFENLGFDMSFIDAAPQETIIDPEMVNKRIAYVDKIHQMGGEVLISTHIQTVLDKKQLIAYAKFHAAHGYDVLKIVAIGKTPEDVENCIEACKYLRTDLALKNTKYTLQLSGEKCVYITRLLCPAFYGSYISFCYPELTEWQDENQLDLDVAVKTLKARIPENQNIEKEKGIEILKSLCTHPQFNKLIKDYEDSL